MWSVGQGDVVQRGDAGIIRSSITDPTSFSAIFERYVEDISRFIRRRCDSDIAEDLVADTFLTAFRSRASFDLSVRTARPWLYGIATNVLRHHYREHSRAARRMSYEQLVAVIEHDSSDGGLSEVDEQMDWYRSESGIEAALGQLDPEMVEPLLLYAYAELTYEEIAQALSLPLGTVRSRISRSRMRLRELLGPLRATTE